MKLSENVPGMEGVRWSPEISHACGHAKRDNKRMLKKLAKHGVDAQGVVIELSQYWSTDYTGRASYMEDKRIRVRVPLPDGSSTEFETVVESPDQRVNPVPGTIVPVRYDPDDPSHIAVNSDAVWSAEWEKLDALTAAEDAAANQAQAAKDAGDQAAIAAAEAEIQSQVR